MPSAAAAVAVPAAYLVGLGVGVVRLPRVRHGHGGHSGQRHLADARRRLGLHALHGVVVAELADGLARGAVCFRLRARTEPVYRDHAIWSSAARPPQRAAWRQRCNPHRPDPPRCRRPGAPPVRSRGRPPSWRPWPSRTWPWPGPWPPLHAESFEGCRGCTGRERPKRPFQHCAEAWITAAGLARGSQGRRGEARLDEPVAREDLVHAQRLGRPLAWQRTPSWRRRARA